MNDELMKMFRGYYKAVTAFDAQNDVHENTTKFERMKIAMDLLKLEIASYGQYCDLEFMIVDRLDAVVHSARVTGKVFPVR